MILDYDKAKKAREKKKSGVNWFLVALALIVVYCSYILINQQVNLSALNEDLDVAKERLATAENENQQLKEENELLFDDAYLEKLAREDLGMTRQEEIPYIYPADKK